MPLAWPLPETLGEVSTLASCGLLSWVRPNTSLPLALPPSRVLLTSTAECAELSMSCVSPVVVAATLTLAMHTAQPINQ